MPLWYFSASQNFGGYEAAGGCYIVKTSDGEAITQLLDGYINLIMDVVSINVHCNITACVSIIVSPFRNQ